VKAIRLIALCLLAGSFALLASRATSQSTGHSISTSTSFPMCTATTIPLPVINVTGGTMVLYAGGSSTNFNVLDSNITDSNSVTWHNLGSNFTSNVCSGRVASDQVWYATGEPAGNDTITVHTGGSASGTCAHNYFVQDFYGMQAVMVDKSNQTNEGHSSSALTLSVTPTNARTLGVVANSTALTTSQSGVSTGGFTDLIDIDNADFGSLYAGYQFFTSSTAHQVGWTLTNSDCWQNQLPFLSFSPSPTASPSPTITTTPTSTITPTPTPSTTNTPTITPTPNAVCTPDFNASIYLLNPTGHIMNGTQSTTPGFTRGNPYFPFLIVNAVGPNGLLTSFTGTPSSLVETPTITARFVDNSGHVCQGADSGTLAQFTATYRACSSQGFVIPCNESGTIAPSNPPNNQPYDLTVTIIDSNGFVDDTF
jgi:hypothetical protein